MSVGIVIPTLNAKKHLNRCLIPLIHSPLSPRVLVVDSSSEDGTVPMAKSLGAETLVIPRNTFNHGTTREMGRKYLETDYVVMVTQDAYAVDGEVIVKLLDPLLKNKASISYARQIPHDGADFFEAFSRQFNYPVASHIRGMEDFEKFGVYTFFCSNSCAAYCQKALDSIGGFEQVLLGEDTLATAKLLKRGHKIAYTAEALFKHSHHLTLREEFKRNKDTGRMRRGYRDLFGKSDTGRGWDYTVQMMKELLRSHPELIPYACAQTLTKWVGYQIGAKFPLDV